MVEYTEEEMEQLQAQQELAAGYGYPTPPAKESIFRFFRELLDRRDSSKFGNLTTAEVGIPDISVRGYQSIALDVEKGWNLDRVSNFLMLKGEQTLATSLSKKGFLAQLFVTQIKQEKKPKPTDKKKGGLFSGFGKSSEEDENV